MSSAGKVLVIDDDPDFLEFTRIILEARGYSVVCAHNAEQGLSLMRTECPDVVLLDILVVDDDPDFIESTRLVLEPNGYEVIGAANSDEGLKKLAEEKPNLVILDVIMSTVLDGLSMSQQMHEIPEYTRMCPS